MIIRTSYRKNTTATITATVTVDGTRHTERGPAAGPGEGSGYLAHERVARALAARLGLADFHDACGIVPQGYRFRTQPETQP